MLKLELEMKKQTKTSFFFFFTETYIKKVWLLKAFDMSLSAFFFSFPLQSHLKELTLNQHENSSGKRQQNHLPNKKASPGDLVNGDMSLYELTTMIDAQFLVVFFNLILLEYN